MGKSYRPRLTGVFGCPVDENPTVVMQEAAFRAKGLDWRYLTLLVEPKDLEEAFSGIRAMHFDGINLTVPHKTEAMRYVDELTEKAKLIGAINTVYVRNNKLIGENTDGAGFVLGLKKQGIPLLGKRICILGAGGASRAISAECALAGAGEITIINRDLKKAESVAENINRNSSCKARAVKWAGTARIPACDLLINATIVGLYPDPDCPDIEYEDISSLMIVQDIIPNPQDTLFLKKARERGARAFDGLSMLVGQGAIAFRLWTGEEAPEDVMTESLKREFSV
jgi:shikimate dehydrogenase